MNEHKKYAIFIDGDNISPRYLEPILNEVAKDGDILIRRIYGDWTTSNMNGWKDLLLEIPIRTIQQFRNGSQATDNAIIMDAIELVNTNKEVNAICIVSSDTDYYSLALKIREYGLFVLGIGAQKSSQLWIKSCNQFKHLENLSEAKPILRKEFKNEFNAISLENLLENAYVNSRMDDDGWVSLSHFGTSIRNTMPDFDPRNFNHATLRTLVTAMPDLYELKHDDLTPPNYFLKKKETLSNSKTLSGVIKKWFGNYGFITTANKEDFFFYPSNIAEIAPEHKIRSGDKVSFDVFKYPNPASKDNAEKNGRAANVKFLMKS